MEQKRKTGRRIENSYSDINTLGKVPPQALELEEAVLGALMLEKGSYDIISEIIKQESFYKESHGIIFKSIQKLAQEKKPIDILTVTQSLRSSGELDLVGGILFISQLTDRVASAANIEYHAKIVAEKYIQRELIRTSMEYAQKGYEDGADAFELLDSLVKELESIRNSVATTAVDTIAETVKNQVELKEKLVKEGVTITGLDTSIPALNKIIGGFNNTDFIILAGRPSMGKSVLGFNFAKNAAESCPNDVILGFSLEMSKEQLINRLIVEECSIPFHFFNRNNLTQMQLSKMRELENTLAKIPLYIDDTPAISPNYIRSVAKNIIRKKKGKKIRLIVIDYLQLMSSNEKAGNREQEISNISRNLKGIAKEFDCPVIALSQLSRSVENNSSDHCRPNLNHLRESGAIEQDADIVGFLYRPSYYYEYPSHPDEHYKEYGEQDYNQAAELIIRKNRNGELGKVRLRFFGEFQKFRPQIQDTFNPEFDEISDRINLIPISNSLPDNFEQPLPF